MTALRGEREPRLRQVLDTPGLAWLVARLRERLERGEPLTGRVSLRQPTPEQRAALQRLFGRPCRGASLTVDLVELEQLLQRADLCLDLRDAVETLHGPIDDRRAARGRVRERWAEGFSTAALRVEGRPALERWLCDLRDTGLLSRLTKNDPQVGSETLLHAVDLALRLPLDGIMLAEFAADATGDAHALDAGGALSTLVLRAAALVGGAARWDDAAERREVWASAGVLCDDLSSGALTLGLWAVGDTLTDHALRLHTDAGEPYRLSLRQLQRDSARFEARPQNVSSRGEPNGAFNVFVCENPSVVSAAATRRKASCAALVCTEGQPSTAVRTLLNQLTAAGARLHYHGDFDWAGLRIANLIMARHGALPWHFGTDDYRLAPRGAVLDGAPVDASWDPNLAAAMSERGIAVQEELVLNALLADL